MTPTDEQLNEVADVIEWYAVAGTVWDIHPSKYEGGGIVIRHPISTLQFHVWFKDVTTLDELRSQTKQRVMALNEEIAGHVPADYYSAQVWREAMHCRAPDAKK